jgi:hypothetical protein
MIFMVLGILMGLAKAKTKGDGQWTAWHECAAL